MRALRLVVVALVALPAACRPGETRLDEHVFHEEPGLRLKVVRYYENLPLHYTGEIFVVQCQSPGTRGFPAHATRDAGWRMLARGGAIGTDRAEDVLGEIEGRYRVFPGPVLVWLGTVFSVSFDGCAHLSTWNPTALPADWIDPAPKPDFCAPKGSGDCRTMDFEGERAPVYDAIEVDAERGHVAFTVTSKAFRPASVLRVTSSDLGRTWAVEPRP